MTLNSELSVILLKPLSMKKTLTTFHSAKFELKQNWCVGLVGFKVSTGDRMHRCCDLNTGQRCCNFSPLLFKNVDS